MEGGEICVPVFLLKQFFVMCTVYTTRVSCHDSTVTCETERRGVGYTSGRGTTLPYRTYKYKYIVAFAGLNAQSRRAGRIGSWAWPSSFAYISAASGPKSRSSAAAETIGSTATSLRWHALGRDGRRRGAFHAVPTALPAAPQRPGVRRRRDLRR